MLSVTHPASTGRLTPYQQQVSAKIKQTLPEIPDVISELIGTYVFDYSLAGQALIFSETGEILNPDLRDMIKLALMSDDCEVSIKQLIFDNMRRYQAEQAMRYAATKDFYGAAIRTDFYKEAIRDVSDKIASENARINLDDVYVEGVSLTGSFNKLTAKRAVFKQVIFSVSQMREANLTDAMLDHSYFYKVSLRSTVAVGLICKATEFHHTEVSKMLTNDRLLLRAGQWEYPRYARPFFQLRCNGLTTTNQDKVNAFRLSDHPPTE